MAIKEELKEYLGKLINRFLFIRMLDDELKMMQKWLALRPEGDITLNIGASFFNLVRKSFDLTLLLELCKFIDDDEDKSLRDWLTQAKMHTKALGLTRYNVDTGKREQIKVSEYQKSVDEQLSKLNPDRDIIKNLKARRDKAIAHTDASFFNNPKDHFEKYPLMIGDIDEILETASTILREQHSFVFESDADLSTVYTVNNLNCILEFVRGFERAQKDEKLKKMGVYIMRYKWDQVK